MEDESHAVKEAHYGSISKEKRKRFTDAARYIT